MENNYFCVRMKTLYLFNPENDMALASASPYYMAPANIKKMAADLAALPAWYVPEKSGVLLADTRQKEWMEKECRFSLPVVWETMFSPYYIKVCPWGWNPSLLRRLAEAGVSAEAVLSEEQMRRVRLLSSRETAVDLLSYLRMEHTIGESFVLDSLEKLKNFLMKDAELLLKSPWSGSGKGLQKVRGVLEPSALGWAKRVIASQGNIIDAGFHCFTPPPFRTVADEIGKYLCSLFLTQILNQVITELLEQTKLPFHCISAQAIAKQSLFNSCFLFFLCHNNSPFCMNLNSSHIPYTPDAENIGIQRLSQTPSFSPISSLGRQS